ncbi:MAG: 3-dehydroquinate synthase, partial [Bacteroidales bacterium]|nr:3-dehydroquinate synthase [Bacteroidales bacterium]
ANVPTTLLSMVDAGIGGKTGVNLDGFKNLLGVIRQPEFTAIFPEVLQTLPDKELRSGLAEMLKTFIIKNPSHAYERTVALFAEGLPAGTATADLSELIQLAAGIKEDIVEKDEFESGVRRKLNLGHTWGHAIEWRFPGAFSHGEAVAIGMVQAARYAEKAGVAEKGLAERIEKDLKACGLPTALPCPVKELMPAIANDKKAQNGQIRLVLPARIGKVVVKKVDPSTL